MENTNIITEILEAFKIFDGIYKETKTGKGFEAEKPPLSIKWSTYGQK